MEKKVEYIHPKTKVVREVEEDYELKITALKRAGFVLKSTYRAPKERVVEPEPTLAEKVEEHGEEARTSEVEKIAEKAIHGEVAPPESGEGDKSEGEGELEPDADESEPEAEEQVEEKKSTVSKLKDKVKGKGKKS